MQGSDVDVEAGTSVEHRAGPEGDPRHETLATPLHRAAEASHSPFAEAWSKLAVRLQKQVLQPLRQGAERHGEIVASIGLDGAPPGDWRARSDQLLEYRRTVATALLEPLAELLEHRAPSGAIAEAMREALGESANRCAALPREVEDEWAEGALAPHPTDGLRLRLGKVLARVVSAARKPGGSRLLPLGAAAGRHLAKVVAPGQDEAAVRAMAAWANWAARLEAAWLEWADTALPALIRAELPGGEDPAELWGVIHEAATGLQDRLDALLSEEPLAEAAAAAEARLAGEMGKLVADLAVAGSFLLRGDNGAPVETTSLRRVERVSSAMLGWDHDVSARMQLYSSILAILSGATAVQRRLVYRCRERSLSRAGDLIEVARKLTGTIDRIPSGIWAEPRSHLAALDSEVARLLEPAFGAIPPSSEVQATVDS
ncbi:MAG TPA: hypothetical protein VLA09_00665, partial [Longimicrobiales bacterium]|nr:hypothetical protein [Longimicrobiales bacterium]